MLFVMEVGVGGVDESAFDVDAFDDELDAADDAEFVDADDGDAAAATDKFAGATRLLLCTVAIEFEFEFEFEFVAAAPALAPPTPWLIRSMALIDSAR